MPRKNGFTLIETLMSSAVLLLFIAGVLGIVQMSSRSMGEARIRSAAIQLGQERLELARNLSYDRVGTIGGIPVGDLIQSETVTRLGSTFTISTVVLYVDDPFDGKAPADLFPNDYKRVRVSVSWQGAFKSKIPVVLMMDISPPGLEADNGGGTISVVVFNSLGQPVENAQVHVEAPTLSPPIAMDVYTDIFGQVFIPGAPVCASCYKITVTKPGYTTERTYSMSEVANPAKPYMTIIKAKVSQVSFAIDTLSTLVIKATRTRTYDYAPFSGVNLKIQGTKVIGTTAVGDPVYKISQTVTTGGVGSVTVPNLDWDNYTISVPSNSTVDFAGSWPFNPVSVLAGQTTQMSVVVDSASANSLLLKLANSTNQPVDNATVVLSKPGFIATSSAGVQSTGDYSQVFFPNLSLSTYIASISALGYETATSSVSINGDVVEKYTLSTP